MKQEDVLRKCIVSGETAEKSKLLRFVAVPGGKIVPDFKKKLPGKGIYVTNSRAMLKTAVEKNLFAKAIKGKARAESGLVDMTEQVLRKRALDSVSLARKAGALVIGLEKVLECLKKNGVAFVLEAEGAGEDGHNRVRLAAKNLKIYSLFSSEELDKALSKTNTVHAAFAKGEMSRMVQNEFDKLFDFLNS